MMEGAARRRRAASRATAASSAVTGRRPHLVAEFALIALTYSLYTLVRDAVPNQQRAAFAHARLVVGVERAVGINVERTVNHAVNHIGPLIVAMNYYYATFHFLLTIAVLVWVYVQRPAHYRVARTTLLMTTVLALIGFYFYPLAPPRLLPGGGYIDTVVVHHTWGAMASGDLAKLSNQYAAMPSMHIGWSLWCACAVYAGLRGRRFGWTVFAYPLFTLAVIIATANHFFVDAAAGALTLAVGWGAAVGVARIRAGAARRGVCSPPSGCSDSLPVVAREPKQVLTVAQELQPPP